jgi:hypothetical protein
MGPHRPRGLTPARLRCTSLPRFVVIGNRAFTTLLRFREERTSHTREHARLCLPGSSVNAAAFLAHACSCTNREVAMNSYVERRAASAGRGASQFASCVLVACLVLLQSCSQTSTPPSARENRRCWRADLRAGLHALAPRAEVPSVGGEHQRQSSWRCAVERSAAGSWSPSISSASRRTAAIA